MADASVTIIGGERVIAALTTFGPRLREQMRVEVAAAAGDLREAVKARVRADFKRHTGDLEKSVVASDVEVTAHSVSASVGSNLAYARIQELGGTIKPKRSRYLAIPLSAMLTGRGVARGPARRVIANAGAFGYESTFFAKHILFGRTSDGAVRPLFALRGEVTLTGRHYFERTYDEKAPALQAALARVAERVLEKVAG